MDDMIPTREGIQKKRGTVRMPRHTDFQSADQPFTAPATTPLMMLF